ncbi:unnamed protein product [Ilex paraguariensis]|uniref:Uncharacterized protein n=1 Tax=Ilex paraguariensis TaxID=185542 RepID=A0ABC8UTM9_9AQUA
MIQIFSEYTQFHHHQQYHPSVPWKPIVSSSPVLSAQFRAKPQIEKWLINRDCWGFSKNFPRHTLAPIAPASVLSNSNDNNDDFVEIIDAKTSSRRSGDGMFDGRISKGSGTTARGRRLLKIREEKRKREYDRLHNYPAWAKVLEDACKNDNELRAVLGDSIGNPELMRKRVEERVRTKGRDFQKSKTGSVLAFKVSFRDFNPVDSYIWFELYGSPSDRDVDLLGSVIQSWYVMGRLGAFNSSNLQELFIFSVKNWIRGSAERYYVVNWPDRSVVA